MPNGPRHKGQKAETDVFLVGIILGVRHRLNESLIGLRSGMEFARTIRRMQTDVRWDKERVLGMRLSVAANLNDGGDPCVGRDGEAEWDHQCNIQIKVARNIMVQ